MRTTNSSKSYGCPTARRGEFYGQVFTDLRKDVPLSYDQLAAFRLLMFCKHKRSEGLAPQDWMGILASVYHREYKVHEEDLLSLHDEMAQVEWRVVHHTSRVNLT